MELKEGMYAYIQGESRDYGIGKIREIHTNGFAEKQVVIVFKHSTHSVEYSTVVGSFNPIDLIQVGDYVNGNEVIQIKNNKIYFNDYSEEPENIKSIVTKEAFKSMEYRLGDK